MSVQNQSLPPNLYCSSLRRPFFNVYAQKCPVAVCLCSIGLQMETEARVYRTGMYGRTHTYTAPSISQQQKRKCSPGSPQYQFYSLWLQEEKGYSSTVLKSHDVVHLCQTIIETIRSIGKLLQQRRHNGTISLFQSNL